MALFPRIQSPCPYKGNLADIMVGSTCQLCQRDVIDLTAMSDAERINLVAGCADEICVSYRLPARTILAAAALGAGFGMAGLAQAQDAPPPSAAEAPAEDVEENWIIVGGLRAPEKAEWVDASRPADMAELPVIEEGEDPAQGKAALPATVSS